MRKSEKQSDPKYRFSKIEVFGDNELLVDFEMTVDGHKVGNITLSLSRWFAAQDAESEEPGKSACAFLEQAHLAISTSGLFFSQWLYLKNETANKRQS